jgi:hypothetical protein
VSNLVAAGGLRLLGLACWRLGLATLGRGCLLRWRRRLGGGRRRLGQQVVARGRARGRQLNPFRAPLLAHPNPALIDQISKVIAQDVALKRSVREQRPPAFSR